MFLPLVSVPPSALGVLSVMGLFFVALGYASMAHPRRLFFLRNLLVVVGPESMSETGVAIYQAVGFLTAVGGTAALGVVLTELLPVGPLPVLAVGAVLGLAGVALSQAGTRQRQHAGIAVVVAGVGLAVGAGVVLA